MKWEEFLRKIEGREIVEFPEMSVFWPNRELAQVQISRWVRSGKLIKVRRGVYVIADPFRKGEIFDFALAYAILSPSYVSLESALEFYGFIPERVNMITSVTTRRPAKFTTPLGAFEFRHISKRLFWGYKEIKHQDQMGVIALPEKAILDFFYFRLRAGESKDDNEVLAFFEEMRFQGIKGVIDTNLFMEYAETFGRRMKCVAEMFISFVSDGGEVI